MRDWVVGRAHSGMNRFWRLLIQWEKKVENYLTLLHFTGAWITRRVAQPFGWVLRASRVSSKVESSKATKRPPRSIARSFLGPVLRGGADLHGCLRRGHDELFETLIKLVRRKGRAVVLDNLGAFNACLLTN